MRKLRNLAFVRHARHFLASKGVGGFAAPGAVVPAERDVEKLQLFGLDQVAVGLCYSPALER